MEDEANKTEFRCVLQDWVMRLPMMQQTVLLTAIRGPDGVRKYDPPKHLLRWYRRCVLLSAIDGRVLTDPRDPSGGSFTGPSFENTLGQPWQRRMDDIVGEYIRSLDAIPHHFQMHFMHAVEILGYKHPDTAIQAWWHKTYIRLVNDMHLYPEAESDLDKRLGDTREGWLQRSDPATTE